MPTINQLVRRGRKKKPKRVKARVLEGRPQLSGIVLSAGIIEPRKPNSGQRKYCRVRLSTGVEVTCLIPGEGHNIQEHSRVLVRAGNSPDLSGIKYKVIRGPRDCHGITDSPKFKTRRNRGRSKYGSKKPTAEELARENRKKKQ